MLLLDYDGTLIGTASISAAPTPEVMAVLGALTADPANAVWIISGRARAELGGWFESLVRRLCLFKSAICGCLLFFQVYSFLLPGLIWSGAPPQTTNKRPQTTTKTTHQPKQNQIKPKQPNLGLAAEHGFYTRRPGASGWASLQPHHDGDWMALALPILKQYQVRVLPPPVGTGAPAGFFCTRFFSGRGR